jgi:hypothetical protein
MAIPPNVPTSFTPKSLASFPRRSFDFGGAFGFVGYFVLILSLLLAIGMFTYDYYLNARRLSLATKIEEAGAAINTGTVADLVQLRDRLVTGKQLLDNHIAISPLFNLLEKLTLNPVRLSTMQITIIDDQKAALSLKGTALSLNALAVESQTFGREEGIEDAIFSGLVLGKAGAVEFSVTAKVEPTLLRYEVSSTENETPTAAGPVQDPVPPSTNP